MAIAWNVRAALTVRQACRGLALLAGLGRGLVVPSLSAGDLDSPVAPTCPARVSRSGQTTSCGSGDGGALKRGWAWPDPRFADHGNGTVTDQGKVILPYVCWRVGGGP